jgi:hypothetical protein
MAPRDVHGLCDFAILDEERKQIVWAYVCRAIYRDPSLTLLTLNYADVPSLFTDPEHDIATVLKLHQSIGRPSASPVLAATKDVLRPTDMQGEYVTVLGVRLYRAPSGLKLPMHAWGHLFAFRKCPGGARALCYTVSTLIFTSLYSLTRGIAGGRSH